MPIEYDIPDAVVLLSRVLRGQSIEFVLTPKSQKSDIPPRVKAWVYGVCRHYYSIQEQLSSLLSQPFKKLDEEVRNTLLIGCFRIQYTQTPKPIVVSASVDAIKHLRKRSASSLVNAVLRKVKRDYKPVSNEAKFELPRWFIEEFKQTLSSSQIDYKQALDRFKLQMPHMLRINLSKVSKTQFEEALQKAEIQYTLFEHEAAVRLNTPKKTASLPGYKQGWFSTQDANAQRAVGLLDLEPGKTVLDACAAPGNKSFQILDQFPECSLTSLDISTSRSRFAIRESRRMGSQLAITTGDATKRDWWDGNLYDCILIDSPCSSTGTIARRPDVKLHRSVSQIADLHERQFNILQNLVDLVKPQGLIIYCTCSLLRRENDNVIARLLEEKTGEVSVEPVHFSDLDTDAFVKRDYGIQLLPHPQFGDGFYFSKLKKLN